MAGLVDKSLAILAFGQTRERLVQQRKKEIEDKLNYKRDNENKAHFKNVKKGVIANKKNKRQNKQNTNKTNLND